MCPYHRGKGISPTLSEKHPTVVSMVGEKYPFSSFLSLGPVSSFCLGSDPGSTPPLHCQLGMEGSRGGMYVKWVRTHLREDRSRVEGKESRRAVVRVVSGQPARLSLPFNCPWFHLSSSTLPSSQRTLPQAGDIVGLASEKIGGGRAEGPGWSRDERLGE